LGNLSVSNWVTFVGMSNPVRVIDLSKAPGEREAWDRSSWVIYLWALCELLFVTNPLQISSRLRVRMLRLFGAKIGEGVTMRPRLRVRFPWKLSVGPRSWIGEGVWIHNQGKIEIGSDVVVSQETFLTTGTHAFRTDMSLKTLPVVIEDGVWITSRCVVLAGSRIDRSAVILPNTVVRGQVPAGALFGTPSGQVIGQRFGEPAPGRAGEEAPRNSPWTQQR
jgi:putative colanic acid biosynthesis acetyltransferase WcaF